MRSRQTDSQSGGESKKQIDRHTMRDTHIGEREREKRGRERVRMMLAYRRIFVTWNITA